MYLRGASSTSVPALHSAGFFPSLQDGSRRDFQLTIYLLLQSQVRTLHINHWTPPFQRKGCTFLLMDT